MLFFQLSTKSFVQEILSMRKTTNRRALELLGLWDKNLRGLGAAVKDARARS